MQAIKININIYGKILRKKQNYIYFPNCIYIKTFTEKKYCIKGLYVILHKGSEKNHLYGKAHFSSIQKHDMLLYLAI